MFGKLTTSIDEEATPIEIQVQRAESEAILWMHLNVLKLSKQFGVDFEGCEWEAISLFMKINSRRRKKMENTTI